VGHFRDTLALATGLALTLACCDSNPGSDTARRLVQCHTWFKIFVPSNSEARLFSLSDYNLRIDPRCTSRPPIIGPHLNRSFYAHQYHLPVRASAAAKDARLKLMFLSFPAIKANSFSRRKGLASQSCPASCSIWLYRTWDLDSRYALCKADA